MSELWVSAINWGRLACQFGRAERRVTWAVAALACLAGPVAEAASPPSGSGVRVRGSVSIARVLTKRRFAVETYAQRGAALPVSAATQAAPKSVATDLEAEMDSVVIYLNPVAAAGSAAVPGKAAAGTGRPPKELVQKNRRFSEGLVVVTVGESVTFPNQDAIFHNVFSLSRTKSFDLGYYPQGQTRTVVFQKPGAVEVFCHLHPNMAATILVVPSASYARPGRDGQFVLDDVPAGEVEVVAWHRSAGFFVRRVQAPIDDLQFVLPLREEPLRKP